MKTITCTPKAKTMKQASSESRSAYTDIMVGHIITELNKRIQEASNEGVNTVLLYETSNFDLSCDVRRALKTHYKYYGYRVKFKGLQWENAKNKRIILTW